MPFGEILTDSVQLIWRNKKLFLFPLIGLALYALGLLIYQIGTVAWIGRYFDWLNALMANPDTIGPDMMSGFFSGMVAVYIAGGIFMILGLAGYFVALVATSGLILEADRARDGEAVDLGRGLREGLGRAGHLLMVQLAWLVPGLLIGCAAFASFFALIFGVGAAGGSGNDRLAGIFGISWFACICGAFCLGLLYAVVMGIFQPLMVQSTVAGRRGVGEAIREGWRLARANLGGVIIMWILVMLAGFVFYVIVQTVSTLASLPIMGVWFASFGRFMQDAQRGTAPQLPAINTPLFLIASLISTAVTLAGMWLLQTFTPVVWNGVYRHLTRPAAPAPVASVDDAGGGDAVIVDHGDGETAEPLSAEEPPQA